MVTALARAVAFSEGATRNGWDVTSKRSGTGLPTALASVPREVMVETRGNVPSVPGLLLSWRSPASSVPGLQKNASVPLSPGAVALRRRRDGCRSSRPGAANQSL